MATKAQCKRALDLHAEQLSGLPNVVGVGIVSASAEDDLPSTGKKQCAVAVYVERATPQSFSAKSPGIPHTIRMPSRGKTSIEVPVRVIEIGAVQKEG